MKVLVINCGSSSIKFQLLEMENEMLLAKGQVERIGMDGSLLKFLGKHEYVIEIKRTIPDHKTGIQLILESIVQENYGVIASLEEIECIGHRVVHGGERFKESVVINDEVLKTISSCITIAPLHNPVNLEGIKICQDLFPGVMQVAVFDTAFHQTIPETAYLYGLPYELYIKYGIRRYGFHGISHQYVADTLAQKIGRALKKMKIITCHLGNGASIGAVKDGQVVDNSMGFTPLEGLVMGTRCGDVDPGALEFLAKKEHLDFLQVMAILNQESGVLGISKNFSSDFRELKDAEVKYNDHAALAREIFSYKVAKYIGSYAAAMNGVDNIVFTAGVGENDSDIRMEICSYLEYLGITIDEVSNRDQAEAFRISEWTSKVNVLVIKTNEELEIAREAAEVARNC